MCGPVEIVGSCANACDDKNPSKITDDNAIDAKKI
jgi:hypothetical protein